jgi:hypothetical protein
MMDKVEQLAGQYRLEAEIGQGSMATVYRAFEPAARREVAIKIFQARFQADPRFALRYRQHLTAVASLEHENLVAVFDYGLGYYIVMEWVDGMTLHTAMAEQGKLTPTKAAAIARQICAALGAVHEHGLVHRDLRPENVFLTAAGQVKLTDVGLSSLLSETGLSKTNVMLSGVDYLSPEQARGEAIGPGSDVYSTGVLLFEMLTGRLPFPAEDTWAVVGMHAADEPPPVRQVNRRVPVELAWIVDRALEKDRGRRFATVQEMEIALAAFAPGELPSAPALAASRAPGDEGQLLAWLAQARGSLWHRATAVMASADALLKDKLPGEGLLFDRLPLSRILLVQYFVSFLIAFLVFFSLSGRALESAAPPAGDTMEENNAAASQTNIDPEQLQSEARFLLRYRPTPTAPAVVEPTEVPPTATPAIVDQGRAQIQGAGGGGNGGNNGKGEGKGKDKGKGNQGKGKGHGKGGKKR